MLVAIRTEQVLGRALHSPGLARSPPWVCGSSRLQLHTQAIRARTCTQVHFLSLPGGRFLFASFLHRNLSRVENVVGLAWKRTILINHSSGSGVEESSHPPNSKLWVPSNSHGQQGDASSAVESTAEPLSGRQIAVPAPIPSGRAKES